MQVLFILGIAVTLFTQADQPKAAEQPSQNKEGPAAAKTPGDKVNAQSEKVKANPTYSKAVLIRFEGMVSPMVEQFLYRKLDAARKQRADLVILEIESPGGGLRETLQIADRLLDIGWAHTVAYIPREALSGAAIVALSCDEIIMAPSARIGDAGPIFQGPDAAFYHAPEKIRTDLVRRVRDLAEERDQSPALAEAMVDADAVVFEVRHQTTGQVTYMTQAELDSRKDGQDWIKGKPVLESRKGVFLELNGTRSAELGLATATLKDRADLKGHFKVDELPVLQPTAVDSVVFILNSLPVTVLLFVIGLIALYIEFSAPGLSFGGLAAILCFSLFFWSRFLGGTADWLEVILFMAGVLFVAAEIFVIPGFGVAGITGILLMFGAVLLACQNFFMPGSQRELNTLTMTLAAVAVSGVLFFAAAMLITRHLGSIPFINRIALAPPAPLDTASLNTIANEKGKPTSAGHPHHFSLQVGDRGEAVSPLRPAGKARFGDDYVDVVADGEFVESGCVVRVIEVSGNRVVVRSVA